MSFLSTKEDNIAKFVKELRESFKLTDTPENKMLNIKKVLAKFNELKDHEKVAIITGAIDNGIFHLKNRSRIYNNSPLARIKKLVIVVMRAFLTISWFGFIALLTSPEGRLMNLFDTVYNFIKSRFSTVFL